MSGLKPLSKAPKRLIRECFERARIYADGFWSVLRADDVARVPRA